MTKVKTRIRIAADGTLTGQAAGLPAGEHEAEIVLIDDEGRQPAGMLDETAILARVRAIQKEVAHLPVLDGRTSDEIIGYNAQGYLD
jgi:hypothetical protein